MDMVNHTHLQPVADLIKAKGISAETLSDDPDVGVAIHFHTEFVDCNDRFCEITGYARDELVGGKAWMLVAPESINAIMKQLNMLSQIPYEITALKKGGEPYQVEITGMNINLNEGIDVRVIFVREI